MKPTAPRQTAPLTVPLGYIRPLLEELERLGGNLDAIWRDAAMATPRTAVRNGSVATLPATEFCRLYRGAINDIERRCCALEGRRPFGKAAVDMLCYCAIHCDTLRGVIARTAEFHEMMEERGGRIRLQEQHGVATFSMDVPGRTHSTAAFLIDVTGLYFYHQFFSWLTGRRLPLQEVRIAQDDVHYPLPLREIFQAPVLFEQAHNALLFPSALLDQRVVRSYAELTRIIDYFPFDLALNRAGQSTWSDHLRLLLLDSLQQRHELPAFTALAQLLHLSAATLRRRLADEGTSYAALRAQCQREIAENLLRQTDLPIDEVAARLAFSDDRAFRRAFREWTGATPIAFREHARSR